MATVKIGIILTNWSVHIVMAMVNNGTLFVNKEASRLCAELLSLVIRTMCGRHADDVWMTYVILQ